MDEERIKKTGWQLPLPEDAEVFEYENDSGTDAKDPCCTRG